jgi:hypothetical protein
MSPSTDLVPVDQIPEEVRRYVPADLPSSTEAIEVWVARAREQAESIQIKTDEDAEAVGKLLKTYASEKKHFDEERVGHTKPLKDAAEYTKAAFDKAKSPIDEAEGVLREKLTAYLAKRKQEEREEQERLDREAEEREEKMRAEREAEEKAKREAAEDAQKLAREAEEIAAEDPELQELVDETRDDAEAARLDADATSALPDPTVPRSHVAPAAKPSGISAPERWVAEVTDITQLPDFLPDGTPLKAVVTSALNGYMHDTIKATGQPPVMPGAKFEKKVGLAVRA